MSRAKLLGSLTAVAFLGVAGMVIRSELSVDAAASKPVSATGLNGDQDAQQKAEQKSEQQAIDSACAALRKMGGTNKNCPPAAK
jgi:hypothetical protein